MVVGTQLYIGRPVNNELVVAISAIGSQQASATEDTMTVVCHLLDYYATYPDDGMVYRPSNGTCLPLRCRLQQ